MKADDLELYIWDFEKETQEKDKKKTLDELIVDYQRELNPKKDEESDWDEVTKIKQAIANKLGLFSQETLTDWMHEILDNIATEFNELKNDLKNHRHELTKNFSSKAEI